MKNLLRVPVYAIPIVALYLMSHRASAVSVCFGECSSRPRPRPVPGLLHNITDGKVFFTDLDFYEVPDFYRGVEHLFPTASLSVRITGKSEEILHQNAQQIPIAGAPVVSTGTRFVPVFDDIDWDSFDPRWDLGSIPGYEEAITQISWTFPNATAIDLMHPVYVGDVIAPGTVLDRYSFDYRLDVGDAIAIGYGTITMIPEPTTMALLLAVIMPVLIQRRSP